MHLLYYITIVIVVCLVVCLSVCPFLGQLKWNVEFYLHLQQCIYLIIQRQSGKYNRTGFSYYFFTR